MPTLTGPVGQGGANTPDDVVAVQSRLTRQGSSPGPADGVCGPRTVEAIRKFQSACGFRGDGLVSPAGPTWLRLCSDEVDEPTDGEVGGQTSAVTAPGWEGDSSAWSQAKKLQSLHPDFRPQVEALMAQLARADYRPKIVFGWRSVAVQRELYPNKRTTVLFSFHNAQRPDGTPCAYAVDLIDSRYAWGPEAERSGYWRTLGSEARKLGLYWDGDWVTFKDWAHVQLVDNDELARIKAESGL